MEIIYQLLEWGILLKESNVSEKEGYHLGFNYCGNCYILL